MPSATSVLSAVVRVDGQRHAAVEQADLNEYILRQKRLGHREADREVSNVAADPRRVDDRISDFGHGVIHGKSVGEDPRVAARIAHHVAGSVLRSNVDRVVLRPVRLSLPEEP